MSEQGCGNLIVTITIGLCTAFAIIHMFNGTMNGFDKFFLAVAAIGFFIRSLRVTAGEL